jgi:type IV pilus assembly protein PilF
MTAGQIALMAILLALAVAAGWMLGRLRDRRGRGPIASGRAAVRAMARRTVRTGRIAHARICPGLHVHLSSRGAPTDAGLRRGQALMMHEARGRPLFRFGLSDLVAGDHPAAVAFYEVVAVDPDVLAPSGVVFTAAPELLRGIVARVLIDAGLEVPDADDAAFSPSSDDPFGALEVRGRGQAHGLPLAGLVGEAAATATPIDVVARDAARRLRAELALVDAFVADARRIFGEDAISIGDGHLTIRHADTTHVVDTHRVALGFETGRTGGRSWLDALARRLGVPRAEEGDPDEDEDVAEDDDAFCAPFPETSGRPLQTGGAAVLVTRRVKPVGALVGGAVGIDRGSYAEIFHIATETGAETLTEDHPLFIDLGLEGVGDLADGLRPASRFTGWFAVTPQREGQPAAWILVGTGVASIATHPDLVAGAAKAVGGPPAGSRVRIHAASEDVLILAEGRADTPFLAGCRRRASVLLDAFGVQGGAPLLVDLTASLGGQPTGTFAFSAVDERFFAAAARCASARAADDGPAAAAARAMMRLSLGDLVGARAHLEEAERIAPEDGEILLALGTLLNELGDHRAAEPVLRRAVGLDAENPAMNNNLGVAYQGLGRLTEAQLFFEKAASLKPQDAVVRVNLGRARLDSGDAAGAEHSFRDALSRDPRCVPALTGLVLVAVREGDVGLARDRLTTALSVDPTDGALLRLHRALHPEEPMH